MSVEGKLDTHSTFHKPMLLKLTDNERVTEDGLSDTGVLKGYQTQGHWTLYESTAIDCSPTIRVAFLYNQLLVK